MIAVILTMVLAASPGLGGRASGSAEADTSQPYLISAHSIRAQLVGQDKITRLIGGVEIVHGSTVLRGDSAWVSTQRQQAEVLGRVTVTDRDVQMSGRRANYYKQTGRAVIQGQAEARDLQWILKADSIDYFRQESKSQAYGRVHISDTSGRQQAWAGFGQFWHQKGYGRLTQSPRLALLEEDGKQRSLLAQTMEVYRQGNIAIASGEVYYYQDSLEAGCGRAVYYRDQGQLVMEEGPRIWQPGARMEAGRIILFFLGDSLRSLEARDSVALYQFRESSSDTDLIRCDSLWADFEGSWLSQARTAGHVWSRYHQREQHGRRGFNLLQSQSMEFYFARGRLRRIVVPQPSRGAFFGEEGR